MQLTWKSTLVLVGATVVVGYVLEQQAKATLTAVANDINPVNPNNVAYSAVNDVGAAVTGSKSFDLGHSIFCWLHPSESICGGSGAGVSGYDHRLSSLLGMPVCR